MSKRARAVPKEIGVFGERQFRETGAALVEVLRVKASTLRKHYKAMRGVVFLVGVVSLDRVRVYFFTKTGVMVSGENMDHTAYEKIRKASRLLAKFEKPKELTPEEKRIEATEELRTAFSKALKRVARFLSVKEPEFPDLYVTHETSSKTEQDFGATWQSSSEITFNQDSLSAAWSKSMLNRVAFALTLPEEVRISEVASCIGNAVSLALLRRLDQDAWLKVWYSTSKETEWAPIVAHFTRHRETYQSEHFNWLRQIVSESGMVLTISHLTKMLRAVHDSCILPLGTEQYHAILGYCKSLDSPRKLVKPRHTLDSIHLSPRVLTLPESLGLDTDSKPANDKFWVRIEFVEGGAVKALQLLENGSQPIDEIEYILNLEDAYPSSGGFLAHGKSIVRNALQSIGLTGKQDMTFYAAIKKSTSKMNRAEAAVYDRLKLGDTEIVMNSLIGSPQHINSLVKSGRLVFLPDFNHLGVIPRYLLYGAKEAIAEAITGNILEATVFKTEEMAYALVSSPSTWQSELFRHVKSSGLSLWAVLGTTSPRRVVRHESLNLN